MPRNAPHIWKSFWSLRAGEWFFIGKRMHQKTNFIQAMPLMESGLVFVAPWCRVKTTQLVKGSKSHPISGTMTGRVNSKVPMAQTGGCGSLPPGHPGDDGRTHFFGDDCPGGHYAENQIKTQAQLSADGAGENGKLNGPDANPS